MRNKRIKYPITAILTLIISFGCIKKSEGLKQSDIVPLVNSILSLHVSQNSFNDEISERTLKNLITSLDPWKLYFTAKDIESFMQNKHKIDDLTYANNYEFLFKIFKRYKTRFNQRINRYKELIKKDYNFNIDEHIEIERDKLKWTENKKEINERWRKQIKFQLLNHINFGKNIKEAKEKVIKKYELVEKNINSFDNDKMFSIFLNSFALALDPHTNYMTSEEYQDFRISMELKLEGIGAILRSEGGFVYIESIIPGGPASKLKGKLTIKPDDKIIAVAQGENEPEDIIDISLRDAVKKIRGKKGTTVKLTIIRSNTKTKKQTRLVVPIVRDKIILEQQAAKSDVHKLKNKKIGYIKLPSFYTSLNTFDPKAKFSSRDMKNAIISLKKKNVDGMIIDLRGNPGGALHEAIKIAGYFIEEGPILQIKSPRMVNVYNDEDPEIVYSGPIVVLINKLSASASEIFAGAIKDYKRGIVLGPSPTFGKGTVQDLQGLNYNKGAIKVTINIFYQPSGLSNNLSGIKPDILVPSLTQLLDIGEDKLKYPLAWKPIEKSKFKTYGNKYFSKKLISKLKIKSSARLKKDKDFVDLNEKIKKYSLKLKDKTISLKKDSDDDINKEVLEEQKEKDKKNKENNIIINTKTDIFLREAFDITSDYIDIIKK